MKNRILSVVFLGLLFLFSNALAENDVFLLPETLTEIESEAFSDISSSAVAIPESVTRISSGAFPDNVKTVYGLPGSFAESYAENGGLAFVSLEIEISGAIYPSWVSPDAPFEIAASSKDALNLSHEFRFVLEKDGQALLDSGYLPEGRFTGALSEGGEYDLTVYARSAYAESARRFEAAVTIGGPVRFARNPLRLNVGEKLYLLAPEETREVTLKIGNKGIASLSGKNATGLKAGTTDLTATVNTPQGVIVTCVPLEVCIPVSKVTIQDPPQHLYVGREMTLSAAVSPSSASHPEVFWTSSNPAVAEISPEGVVTAFAPGETTLTATADGVSVSLTLRAIRPVEEICLTPSVGDKPIYVGDVFSLTQEILPENADEPGLVWKSLDKTVATVDANGVVTSLKTGLARIECTAKDGGGAVTLWEAQVYTAPKTLSLSVSNQNLFCDRIAEIQVTVTPEKAYAGGIVWQSSDETVAVVDAAGRVKPAGKGNVTITAVTPNGLTASITLKVYETAMPTGLKLSETMLYLNPGEAFSFSYSTVPASAEKGVVWESSYPNVASVDQNGVLTAHTSGATTVTIVSKVDASLSASCKVTILNPNRTLVMPARRTDPSGIQANLNKISAVRKSAHDELDALTAEGKITPEVRAERQRVVDAAFAMYSFPWMTLSEQEYWKLENNDGGAKDFKPGIVYYGLPYISRSYDAQRLYNVSKALSENRYYLSDSGDYYILNQDNLRNGKYCGNDCSSMVALSYIGPSGAGVGSWSTHTLATTADFVTQPNSAELHPGDILVWNYRHVVMFLYYANSERTQMVIIEQGGSEFGCGTISTSVHASSYYLGNGYSARRLKAWIS